MEAHRLRDERNRQLFRVLNGIFLVMFIVAAAVQYNDADGLLWALIYGYAVLLCLMAYEGKFSATALVVTLAYLLGFAFTVPGWGLDTVALLKEPKMSSIEVEQAREAFGLLICAFWTGVLSFVWYRKRKKLLKMSEE